MSDPRVLRHVIEAITPASDAFAEGARLLVAHAASPVFETIAMRLAGAQHTARPRTERRTLLVVAGDHGVGDPGIALGAAHPTVIAATAIADGTAAVTQVARTARAPIVLVDAGVREPAAMPSTTIALGRGPSQDLTRGPAMTIVDAAMGLEAGIALAISLSEPGLDVLAVGALGVGAEVSAAALTGAITRHPPANLGDALAEEVGARAVDDHPDGALELLATFGGPETAVLAGVMLGAASMNIPIVLDNYATGAAALVASRFAPSIAGYFLASQLGTSTQPLINGHLHCPAVFMAGIGHGEGTGAAMALPLLDQVAALTIQR
ncbi:MAG: nicotinate-nucleotide--dimethylbenzimidazole phosphoribosyltransferase [Kofleriaceae bacterium]|nr:nicotinate-nucleotide--dimethylbenzimidazole phosphoribosyltransferase [Kofleriaceae bacterium]